MKRLLKALKWLGGFSVGALLFLMSMLAWDVAAGLPWWRVALGSWFMLAAFGAWDRWA